MKKQYVALFTLIMATSAVASTTHHHQEKLQLTPMQQELMSGMNEMHNAMANGMMNQDADIAFAAGMIPHHQGAVKMAEVELKYGKDPELRKLAQAIIDAQKTEIEFMQNWLKKHKTL